MKAVNQLAIVLSLVTTTACQSTETFDENLGVAEGAVQQVSNQVLIDWNIHTETASGTNSPPRRARTYAMVSLAMHDALMGIESKFTRFASTTNDAGAQPVAAAAQAAHDVLVALFPAQTADLDAKLAASLAPINDGDAKTRGIALGAAAAAAVLAARASDGASTVLPYTPTIAPGFWRPTPPAFAPALEPNWGNVVPFGLISGDQFRAPAPYALDSAAYAADVNEVQAVGSATSTTRTADETSYAHFWYEPSAVGWNRLARTALSIRSKNIWKTGRLFALMNMALADGYIASFDSKYFFHLWRPITAIREADTDGNAATIQDATWTPLRPTPPMSDHTSGHAVVGFAARAALVEVFGDDVDEPMTMTSLTAVPAGSTRSWETFTQAAKENAESRIKVGIHFRKACDDGEVQGRDVGSFIVENQLVNLD